MNSNHVPRQVEADALRSIRIDYDGMSSPRRFLADDFSQNSGLGQDNAVPDPLAIRGLSNFQLAVKSVEGGVPGK